MVRTVEGAIIDITAAPTAAAPSAEIPSPTATEHPTEIPSPAEKAFPAAIPSSTPEIVTMIDDFEGAKTTWMLKSEIPVSSDCDACIRYRILPGIWDDPGKVRNEKISLGGIQPGESAAG